MTWGAFGMTWGTFGMTFGAFGVTWGPFGMIWCTQGSLKGALALLQAHFGEPKGAYGSRNEAHRNRRVGQGSLWEPQWSPKEPEGD